MAIDYQKITKEYKEGDIVQRWFPDYSSMSPFVGRVTAALPGIGCCDVQWPYGNERVPSDELVKCNPELLRYLPPTMDSSYLTLEIQKARKASVPNLWRTTEVPPGFHMALARMWSKRVSEVAAYDELWHRHTSAVRDEELRDEVAKFYRFASNLVELRIQAALRTKEAAYWVSQNRQYRVTQQELTGKKPMCPKCGTSMRRTTFRMQKGAKERLFACPKDLFLIKIDDLLAPDGGPVGW